MARRIGWLVLLVLLLSLSFYSAEPVRALEQEDYPQNAADLQHLYTQAASVADKLNLISAAGDLADWQLTGTPKDEVVNWLEDLSRNSEDSVVRQSALCQLYSCDAQREDAVSRLVQEIDTHGLARAKDANGWLWPQIGWPMLQEIYKNYPDSYLTKGITAYEKVRGASYFALERRKLLPQDQWNEYTYGDQQYDPDREIPGWESFLKEFPNHPGADDAAYRLARCYEIKGRYGDALHTLLQATLLPDGDIIFNVCGRLTYILDVRMSGSQLEDFISTNPEPALRQMAEYTLAVKNMRSGNYQLALTQLEKFLADLRSGAVPANLPPFMHYEPLNMYLYSEESKYDFSGGVEKQLGQARVLADLVTAWQKSNDPSDLYALAAVIFHDETIYYNHLWAGYRQSFNAFNNILTYVYNQSWDDPTGPPEMAEFAREMINYYHSAPLFEQVYQNPAATPELKAKALFSLGLSQQGIYNWGQDALLTFNRNELQAEIKSTFEKFLDEFPHSSMADEALLALAGTSRQRVYLERIFKEYPNSDSIDKAKDLLNEIDPGISIYTRDGRILHANDNRIFPNKQPFIDQANRLQVPLEVIGEALGCQVDWREQPQQVTCTTEGLQVIMTVGKKQFTVNGVSKTMDTTPLIIDGQVFIPIKAMGEALNIRVDWSYNTVYIFNG